MAASSDIPTLARLSFWVPKARMDDFAEAYERQVAPVFKEHGLKDPQPPESPEAAGVFSRLFAVGSPSAVEASQRALRRDPSWQETLRRLGTAFGMIDEEGLLRHHFGIYRTPAGPGKTVEVGPGFRQGLWHSFGLQDGLPASTVLDLLQDREGNVWFAMERGGVIRFDGDRLLILDTVDGLAGDTVNCMLEDREGNLWFGTEGNGVSCFDGRCFAHFSTADGLAGDVVNCMLEDREGNLWFGTEEGGASSWDGEKFTTISPGDSPGSRAVRCMLEDRTGRLWFGTRGGAGCYDGRRFVNFSTADGLGSDRVEVLLEDRQGCLWLGTWDGGLCRWDGRQFETIDTPDHRLALRFSSLLEDREGRLWVGTWGMGLMVSDGAGFTAFTMRDGLPSDLVLCLLEDRLGILWAGTLSGGVCCCDKGSFACFQGEMHGPMVLLEDRSQRLWVGTWNGVYRRDGARFEAVEGLADKTVTAAFEDPDGRIWFGFRGGVGYFADDRIEILLAQGETSARGSAAALPEGPPGNVEALLKDRSGSMWIGTSGGLIRYDGSRLWVFTAADGLGHDQVRSLLEDRSGNLWIGTEGGLTRYDGSGFRNYTVEDGLPDNEVSSLFEDGQGRLWIGTTGGITCFDGAVFTRLSGWENQGKGLILGIAEDRSGQLWFGIYGGGVVRYDGQVFQFLRRKDGLAHDAIQHILQDRTGDMWIAAEGGLTRYRPADASPIIHLTDVVADRHYGPVEALSVSVSHKLVAFEFRGISWTTRAGDMAYVYCLKGHDSTWLSTRDQRVEYRDLPLGTYSFQVRAVDRDLNYSATARVEIQVVPDPYLEALHAALSGSVDEFIGDSPALLEVQKRLAEVAATDATVLILGETGTGKGLAARTLHAMSPRQAEAFVQVNCGALSTSLVESELFGHEKGAFTGAHSRKLGKVELARGGTLFLDEIGDMALEAQVKLLQLLEEQTFERVGGTQTLRANVRVIAASNRDIEKMVASGTFRADLFFRLQVFPLQLPSLRQRREDIPLLATYFASRKAAHLNKKISGLDPAALRALQAYDWPGNVRELEHAVQRAVIVCSGQTIQVGDISLPLGRTAAAAPRELVTLEELERNYILEVLERTGGTVKGPRGAAAILGIPDSTLRYRMKKLGIKRARGR